MEEIKDTPQECALHRNIDVILQKEANRNIKESWNKLDQTTKINRLDQYARQIGKERGYADVDIENLIKYLVNALERKRLASVKEVIYDNETGKITKIPCLIFSSGGTNNRYTLKRLEKRVSTLKALGPGRNKKKSDKIDMVMN